jgi:hypothetical protein
LESKGLVKVIPGSRYLKVTWCLQRWRPSAEIRRQREAAAAERARKDEARRQQTNDRFEKAFGLDRSTNRLSRAATDKLAKLLGMLGSEHEGEVLSAARKIEAERKRLERTWEQLLGR